MTTTDVTIVELDKHSTGRKGRMQIDDYPGIMFTLRYHGGPDDGREVISPRPYDTMKHPDGSIYRAEQSGPACLIWLSDNERAIDLHYVGKKEPPSRRVTTQEAP